MFLTYMASQVEWEPIHITGNENVSANDMI